MDRRLAECLATDPASFAEGVARRCRSAGRPDMFGLVMKAAEYASVPGLDPRSFVKGASAAMAKSAGRSADSDYELVRRKGLVQRLIPWIAAIGGAGLAMEYGNAWGRYAHATGDENGPMLGTGKKILEGLTGMHFKRVPGPRPDDGSLDPRISNDEYVRLVTHGTKHDPSRYDFKDRG